MNKKIAVNKNLKPKQFLEPIHRKETGIPKHEQRPRKKRKGRGCDIHLLEVLIDEEDESSGDKIILLTSLEQYLKKICYLFPDAYIVVKMQRILIVLSEVRELDVWKLTKHKYTVDFSQVVELLGNRETIVLLPNAQEGDVRIIRKELNTKTIFNYLENEIYTYANTKAHRAVFISDIRTRPKEILKEVLKKSKIDKPRTDIKRLTVLPCVCSEEPFAKQKEYLCYPGGVQVTNDDFFLRKDKVLFSTGYTAPRDLTTTVYNRESREVFSREELSKHSVHRPRTPQTQQTQGTTLPRRPRYPEFIDYHERLKTYARWTHTRPDSTTLAFGGFFYTNNDDLVRCYQCGIGLKDFSYTDNPIKEHVKNSADCPHLQECLTPQELAELKKQIQNEDQKNTGGRYRHPDLQSYQARLDTFAQWPRQIMQTPKQLAGAGLYYTGTADCVRCFACDGGMKDWDPADDPWTEHCKWFPKCPYAREIKGDSYIAAAQRELPEQPALQRHLYSTGLVTIQLERIRIRRLQTHEAATNCFVIDEPKSNSLLSEKMNSLTIRDQELQKLVDELQTTLCSEMGFEEKKFKEAVEKLLKRGQRPTIDNVLEAMEKITYPVEAEEEEDDPVEENRRLKGMVFCVNCSKNEVNALFLPCSHHRLCMTCAEGLIQCNICGRNIQQKIKTFMA